MQFLGGAIVAVIVINAVFSFWQEYRAERELEALARLLPLSVLVRRENRDVQVDAGQLVPGDLVFLGEGGRVPADVRLLESHGLQVNNAPLTGESRPLDRNNEPAQLTTKPGVCRNDRRPRQGLNRVRHGDATEFGEGRPHGRPYR
jgi:P-type E1-E2 ATPase